MTTIAHIPVLLSEVLEHLELPAAARVLDLTLGLGGHASALLANADRETRYLGVDRDANALRLAQDHLGNDARLTVIQSAHEDVWEHPLFTAWIAQHGAFDIILMDLGVSNLQLKDPARGFSFLEEGPLDMRMDSDSGTSALQWIREQREEDLANVLYQFGEERASRPIARAILRALTEGRLSSTLDLAAAVYTVLPREIAKRKGQIDPATRTFQAIRIAVNGELTRLEQTIERAVQHLKPSGRIGVISFHSLEDRIVKQVFRRLSGVYDGPGRMAPAPLPTLLRLIQPGGLVAGTPETASNPSSRSARLRIAERLPSP